MTCTNCGAQIFINICFCGQKLTPEQEAYLEAQVDDARELQYHKHDR